MKAAFLFFMILLFLFSCKSLPKKTEIDKKQNKKENKIVIEKYPAHEESFDFSSYGIY